MSSPTDVTPLLGACPDLSDDARTILTDHDLTFGQRIVLLAHLADPTLRVGDLARAVGCSRSVARDALRHARDGQKVATPDGQNLATDGRKVTTGRSETARPSRARPVPCSSSEEDESSSPEASNPSTAQRLLDVAPATQEVSERKKRIALARDFLDARARAGYSVDPRDLERDCRRVVVALAPFVTTHSREDILAAAGTDLWAISDRSVRIALNKLVAARRNRRPTQAASNDPTARAEEAADKRYLSWKPE